MKCKRCSNELPEQRKSNRRYCKACQHAMNLEHQRASRVRRAAKLARLAQLEKEVKRLRQKVSTYKGKTKRLVKVVRAVEQSLVARELKE
jgi:hypothetical protein